MRKSEKFTGERLTAEDQTLFREHMARYAFAKNLIKGGRVLDVACGRGFGSLSLAETAGEVIGLDLDAESIAYAKKRWYHQPNLRFQTGDALRLPFPDDSFDTVVSLETIEHLRDQRLFLREIRRVLKPKGRFIISTPDREVTRKILIDTSYRNPFHLHEFSLEEFKSLLSSHFLIVGVYGQFLYHPSRKNLLVRNCLRFFIRPRAGKILKQILPLSLTLWIPRLVSGTTKDCRVYRLKEGQQAQFLVLVCRNDKEV
jgi:ubiquinone/menaquinone biosynthesis C-methylase UbiE